jgi:hypothetical protein
VPSRPRASEAMHVWLVTFRGSFHDAEPCRKVRRLFAPAVRNGTDSNRNGPELRVKASGCGERAQKPARKPRRPQRLSARSIHCLPHIGPCSYRSVSCGASLAVQLRCSQYPWLGGSDRFPSGQHRALEPNSALTRRSFRCSTYVLFGSTVRPSELVGKHAGQQRPCRPTSSTAARPSPAAARTATRANLQALCAACNGAKGDR